MDESIEGIIVVSPAESHYEIKELLLAGMDVFVEKPLALGLKARHEIIPLGPKLSTMFSMQGAIEIRWFQCYVQLCGLTFQKDNGAISPL